MRFSGTVSCRPSGSGERSGFHGLRWKRGSASSLTALWPRREGQGRHVEIRRRYQPDEPRQLEALLLLLRASAPNPRCSEGEAVGTAQLTEAPVIIRAKAETGSEEGLGEGERRGMSQKGTRNCGQGGACEAQQTPRSVGASGDRAGLGQSPGVCDSHGAR
jgi:hypothetical protein